MLRGDFWGKINTFARKTVFCTNVSWLLSAKILTFGELFQQCRQNKNVHVQKDFSMKDCFFERHECLYDDAQQICQNWTLYFHRTFLSNCSFFCREQLFYWWLSDSGETFLAVEWVFSAGLSKMHSFSSKIFIGKKVVLEGKDYFFENFRILVMFFGLLVKRLGQIWHSCILPVQRKFSKKKVFVWKKFEKFICRKNLGLWRRLFRTFGEFFCISRRICSGNFFVTKLGWMLLFGFW